MNKINKQSPKNIPITAQLKAQVLEKQKELRKEADRRIGCDLPERKKNLQKLQKFGTILEDPDFQKLKTIKRHNTTDTYKHSLRVAMIAADLAEKFHEDPDAAVRAGLLHDYCLMDHNLKGKAKREAKKAANAGLYCFYHPKNAAENSAKFHLSQRETDAIATHMFPLGPLPKSRLGWIIRLADIEAGTEEVLFGKKKQEEKRLPKQ